MAIAAPLATAIAAALSAEAPQMLCQPNRRLLVQYVDTDVVALDLDAFRAGRTPEVHLPAP
ncbi:hypothetical protein [Streptomyces sp. HF10]|uniref:hypothetical protein n=1 Tax=Streptomyces sp. HF10 TaxID=2692233 RepID=UPI0013175DC1|nr:hypothetical protein [Streptomyces sp. HF10]QHC32455.1 hypothetical protein GR129_30390 [Streptomyces sp. HF10]